LGRIHVLERTQTIARPPDEVFPFFSDPHNLAEITPPFVHFRVLTPRSIPMTAGMLIDYRLRLFGVPFRWQTRVVELEPPRRFVDVQLRGPYASWEHTHEFVPTADGTRMRDRVRYALPLGPLGRLAHALFVARTLDAIFDYRHSRIEEIFA
jgi:ligand-binding SRPBCC domain-containing protein